MMLESEVSPKVIRGKLRNIFDAVKQQAGHHRLVESAKKLYLKCDHSEAIKAFIDDLKYVFVYPDKPVVDKIISFTSKFALALYSTNSFLDDSEEVETENPFLNELLAFLSEAHWATSADVRLRCITLINYILEAMPTDANVPVEMWDILTKTICARIQDRRANVRVAAVLVARKLQEPKNPKCQIMKLLTFHICDPAPAVRRAVISSIALTNSTIALLINRTLDVNENVRRNVYAVVAKVRFQHLTINDRVKILERGLKDRSDTVRNCVENVLIEQWLDLVNQDPLKFIECLDSVICPEVSIMVVEAILKNKSSEDVVKFLPIDGETHLIPNESLTPESALLWRCMAGFFLKKQMDDELDSILPNLSAYCDHIEKFCPKENEQEEKAPLSNDEEWAELKKKRVLLHLLELAKAFDLRDEMGRLKLRKLIESMLTNLCISNEAVECLLDLLHRVIPDQNDLISSAVEVISELREPLLQSSSQGSGQKSIEQQLKISGLKLKLNGLKEQEYEAATRKSYAEAARLKDEIEKVLEDIENESNQQPAATLIEAREERTDPETLCRCLSVLIHAVRVSGVTVLTPPLRSMKDELVYLCLRSEDLLTQSLAVQALAQFCLLDKDTAQDKLVGLFYMLSESGENKINIPALKAVFDIFQTFGLEAFEKVDESIFEESLGGNKSLSETINDDDEVQFKQMNKEPEKSKPGTKFISFLKGLLNCSSNDEMKQTTFEGFCKLLASGVIYSPTLLKSIIIKGFTPIRGNESEDRIRQIFMVFFPFFAHTTARSQEMIEAAFIPVMRCLNDAQLGSPEIEINARDVATFLIDHTKPNINPSTSQTVHVHNSLAIAICLEILRDVSLCVDLGFDQNYLHALFHLHLTFESEALKQQLLVLLTKISREMTDTTNLRLIKQFQTKVIQLGSINSKSIENTLQTTQQSSRRASSNAADNSSLSESTIRISTKDPAAPNSSELDTVAEVKEDSFVVEETSLKSAQGVIAESSDSESSEIPSPVITRSTRKRKQ